MAAFKELALLNQAFLYEISLSNASSSSGLDVKPRLADLQLRIKSEPLPQADFIYPDPEPGPSLVISAVTSVPAESGPDAYFNGHLEDVNAIDDDDVYSDDEDDPEAGSQEDDPLDEADIEFVVADAEDMDSSFTGHSEATDDPIADPFSMDDEDHSFESPSSSAGPSKDDPNRRHSSRRTNKHLKYFMTKGEEMEIKRAVKGFREDKRVGNKRAREDTLSDDDDSKVEVKTEKEVKNVEPKVELKKAAKEIKKVETPPISIIPEKTVAVGPVVRLPKLRNPKGCVRRRLMLKQQLEEEKLEIQGYKFKYDQWSLKVDDFIRRFFPILSCKFCDQKFGNFTDLRNHMARAHVIERKGWFSCCGRDYLTRSDLFKHIHHHISPTREPACKTCLLVFDTKKKFSQHNIDFHSPTADRLPCPGCEEAFGSKFQLYKHYLSHLVFVFICPLCPDQVQFETSKSLHSHLALWHPKDLLPFECQVCPFKVCSRSQKLNHEANVHGIHVSCMVCVYCGFKTANVRGFVHHFRLHTQKKDCVTFLDCPDCDLVFLSLKALRLHEDRIHSAGLL